VFLFFIVGYPQFKAQDWWARRRNCSAQETDQWATDLS